MNTMNQLDAKQDKLHFLQSSKSVFTEPKAFQFEPHKGDPVSLVCANQTDVLKELEERFGNLLNRIKDTSVESDELLKTLEAAEQSWLEQIIVPDFFVSDLFNRAGKEAGGDVESAAERGASLSSSSSAGVGAAESGQQPHAPENDKKRAWENGEFYLSKFDEYLRKNSHLTRLHAKASAISRALSQERGSAPPPLPTKPRRKSIIRVNAQLIGGGRPRLFGGSIDSHSDIPIVVLSCVQLIKQFGLFHQGVFRVPGSQSDVNRLKEAFERGEDPFSGAADGRDVNAAAGVLKCYLRDLEEPVFPPRLFDDLMDCVKKDNVTEAIVRLRELFQQLSPNCYRVLRFIFAFLNHLSQFADENLMDSYNLSICLAPSFLPVPTNRDPVIYQGSITHLMKIIIEHESEVFVRKDVPGPIYRKRLEDDFDVEDEEEQSVCSEMEPESGYMVTAKYAFEARTPRELSFGKGDVLTVLSRLTPEWLRGVNASGKEGLVPDAYVTRLRQSATESDAIVAGAQQPHSSQQQQQQSRPQQQQQQQRQPPQQQPSPITTRTPAASASPTLTTTAAGVDSVRGIPAAAAAPDFSASGSSEPESKDAHQAAPQAVHPAAGHPTPEIAPPSVPRTVPLAVPQPAPQTVPPALATSAPSAFTGPAVAAASDQMLHQPAAQAPKVSVTSAPPVPSALTSSITSSSLAPHPPPQQSPPAAVAAVSLATKSSKSPSSPSSASAASASMAQAAADADMQSIDQALQEVIAGLELLTYDTDSPYADPQALISSKVHLPAAKRAPDLVSDLPESAADRFALEGHADTLRVRRCWPETSLPPPPPPQAAPVATSASAPIGPAAPATSAGSTGAPTGQAAAATAAAPLPEPSDAQCSVPGSASGTPVKPPPKVAPKPKFCK